jgi:hypothetical protein
MNQDQRWRAEGAVRVEAEEALHAVVIVLLGRPAPGAYHYVPRLKLSRMKTQKRKSVFISSLRALPAGCAAAVNAQRVTRIVECQQLILKT